MENINEKLSAIDWQKTASQLNEKGYALVENILSTEQCGDLISDYENPDLYRKTVVMARHRFGLGEYKYFKYPLPELIQNIRQNVYAKLSPIASNWMRMLNIDRRFPETLEELQRQCHERHQSKPTPLILKYSSGGYNTLHQDLYGEIFFPMQLVLFLNEPEEDYTGGEFVLVRQVPRAQSQAIVLKPRRGDMLIFTTSFKPEKGTRGYFRVNIKHGVSEIHGGNRHTLGIIFHDALN